MRVKKYERQRQNTPGIETHPSMKESKQRHEEGRARETEGRKVRDTRRGAMSKPRRESEETEAEIVPCSRVMSVKKYERDRRNTPGIETHPSRKESKQSERDTKRGRRERRRGERHEEGR